MAEGVKRGGDPGLRGRVSGRDGGRFHKKRVQGILDQVDPAGSLGPSTEDVYPAGGDVSMEEAAQREFELKRTLDDDVASENLYDSDFSEHGVPPCKRRGS